MNAENFRPTGRRSPGDFAFRACAPVSGKTYQMLFDLDAMEVLCGTGAGNIFPGSSGIGTFGNNQGIPINGLDTNDVAFSAPATALDAVPEPGSMTLVAMVLLGFGAARRRVKR